MTDTERVEKIIKERGLKKKFVARELGLTPYGFALKLRNESEFKASEITKLCAVLGIDSAEEMEQIFFVEK